MAVFEDKWDLWYRDVVLKNTGKVQRIYFFKENRSYIKAGSWVT